jgi:hypothetical protein
VGHGVVPYSGGRRTMKREDGKEKDKDDEKKQDEKEKNNYKGE